MHKNLAGAALAIVLASGSAIAQTPAPTAPATPPSSTATLDAATEAKFKSADKNNSGALDGAETDAYKADITKIDTNKDGKVSRDEFGAAVKSGLIK